MISALSQIAFINPWILAVAAILPVLWFLLRVMPPAPKRISFPATRFLKDLIPERASPSKTPWWLLLLRCLIIAAVILALAGPVLNPAGELPTKSNIRIVIDTGWAAAQTWDKQIQAAEEIIAQAEREKRSVYILTTTAEASSDRDFKTPLSPPQASAILRALKPHSWPADYSELTDILKDNKPEESVFTFWLR